MATVTKYPQSNDASSWTNPTNVYADDGVYATAEPAQNSYISGLWYNFDFGIPAGSEINQIDIEVQWKVSTVSSIHTFGIRPCIYGVVYGTELIVSTEPTSDRTDNKTTANGYWTVSNINTNTINGFAVQLRSIRGNSATAVTCSVDYIKVTVTYETSPSPIEIQQDAGEFDAVGTAALVSVTTGHLTDVVQALGTAELVNIAALGAIGTAELMAYVDITKAFLHDASSGYTNYTTAANEDTADDVALLPASIGANDAFYFLEGPYGDTDIHGLLIEVTTAGIGSYTLAWEYYNGSDWVSLVPYIISFGSTYDYKSTSLDYNKIDYSTPLDMSDVAINGISGKWIRARYVSGTLTTQPLAKRIYVYAEAPFDISSVAYYLEVSDAVDITDLGDDNLVKSFNKSLSDNVDILDTIIKSIAIIKTDIVDIEDLSYNAPKSFYRSFFDDALGIYEFIIKDAHKSISDIFDVVDTVSKSVNKPFSDTFSITDWIIKAHTIIVTDIIDIIDTIDKALIYAPEPTKVRKVPKKYEAEDEEWHDIIEIERWKKEK